MVDSDKGITNLHVPSDVIVDASMPAMIRTSGQMWNADGEQQDTKAVIPDSSYAGIYQVVIDDCRANGAYDPPTMGSVPNVGLMAQAAEEYGSHDKTFEIAAAGTVRVVDGAGTVAARARRRAGRHLAHVPGQGPPDPGLGEARRHPRPRHRCAGGVLARRDPRPRRPDHREGASATCPTTTPTASRSRSWRRSRPSTSRSSASAAARTPSRSPATCCATTSPTCSRSSSSAPAPRCCRSCRSSTAAACSRPAPAARRPKHVQQFVKENHLRWDSLGEFLALAVSFEHLAETTGNQRAQVLADTLDRATGHLPRDEQVARRKARRDRQPRQPLYLARYWAEALAAQTDDAELAAAFAPLAERLAARPRPRSSPSSSPSRAARPTSAATTAPTTPRPRRSCARARRSTRPSAYPVTALEPHSLVAFNTATASANKIHDDAVAQQFGFRGGLVPGVDVYAYLCHPPAAAWGLDWLRHGTMRARFHRPVYDGHQVTSRRTATVG